MRNETKTLNAKFIEPKYVQIPHPYNWIKAIDKKMSISLKIFFDTVFGIGMLLGIAATWNTWVVLIPVLVSAFYWIPMGLIRWEQYFAARNKRRLVSKNKKSR